MDLRMFRTSTVDIHRGRCWVWTKINYIIVIEKHKIKFNSLISHTDYLMWMCSSLRKACEISGWIGHRVVSGIRWIRHRTVSRFNFAH